MRIVFIVFGIGRQRIEFIGGGRRFVRREGQFRSQRYKVVEEATAAFMANHMQDSIIRLIQNGGAAVRETHRRRWMC